MNKWIFFLVLILGIAGLFYLQYLGIINWQLLTILGAAAAAPVKFVLGLFSDKEEQIRKKFKEERETEFEYQENLENRLESREKRVEVLKNEIDILDRQLELLEKKRDMLKQGAGGRTVSERQKEGENLLGS